MKGILIDMLIKAILVLLKRLIDSNLLMEIARGVKDVENTDLAGDAKRQYVRNRLDALVRRMGVIAKNIPSFLINLAIEVFVLKLQKEVLK